MTLAEKLAAKKAAAGVTVRPDATAPRDDLPAKGEGLAATTMASGRQIGYTGEGEHIPMLHEREGLAADWSRLCHSYETDWCIVLGPGHKDEAWLGVRAKDQAVPLLVCKLPLVMLPGAMEPF